MGFGRVSGLGVRFIRLSIQELALRVAFFCFSGLRFYSL